jgi:hypothetical protein
MGGIRKLRRRSRSTQYAVEPLRTKLPVPLRKMSDMLRDFAEPLLNTIDDDDELFEEVIGFAAICWNLSFLPENEQKQTIRSMVDKLGKSDVLKRLKVENDVQMLLERKKAFFADEKRMVVNYEIIEDKGSRHLLAMSVFTKDRAE